MYIKKERTVNLYNGVSGEANKARYVKSARAYVLI